MTERQAYKILEISCFSSDEVVSQSYKQLIKKYHPDKCKNDRYAKDKFAEVKEAYKLITKKRKERREKFNNLFKGKQENDVNNDMNTEAKPQKGSDVHLYHDITFEEAAKGCDKDIIVNKLVRCDCLPDERKICENCKGTGKILKTSRIRIHIPSSVFNKQTIIVRGKGNVGDEGAEKGDLYIKLNIKESDIYTRRGLNIYSDLYLTYPEFLKETKKYVQTIYGLKPVLIKDKEPGAKISLNGKGILNEETGEIGNHIVTLKLYIPHNLTDKQKKLIDDLEASFDSSKEMQ